MSKKIGVIAEDNSDIAVINEILEKYMETNSFAIKRFVGNGCGKLRHKCSSWAKMLSNSGCEHILVFHDLDRNCEKELRAELSSKVCKENYPKSLIVIPKEEMEAWLLSDLKALKVVFNLKRIPKKISCCESIISPKEHIRNIVWANGKKRYLNTAHNQKIAKHSSISNFNRCASYKPLDSYIRNKICA